jgi:hypothetical protein
MEMTMKFRLIIAVALLSTVGACAVGPYDGQPAYYNGGYNSGYNGGYNSGYNGGYNSGYNGGYNTGYDRTYYGYNRTYYNGRYYQ